MRIIGFFLITVLVLISCNDANEPVINSDNLLLGSWSKAHYENDEVTFTRVASLPKEAYGISFLEEGNFIERTSGWCGTPPLSFFTIEGTWSMLDKLLIEVTTQDFQASYNLRIVSLTAQKLVVKRELTEQEKDHRALMDLFSEIESLAYSVVCSDASNWLYTSYGSKPCGASQGYIAYANKIDTELFLQKVATYTQAEKQYNIKWDIISNCNIPKKPTGVACQNGTPVFIY